MSVCLYIPERLETEVVEPEEISIAGKWLGNKLELQRTHGNKGRTVGFCVFGAVCCTK
jgi:hypothetical protein